MGLITSIAASIMLTIGLVTLVKVVFGLALIDAAVVYLLIWAILYDARVIRSLFGPKP